MAGMFDNFTNANTVPCNHSQSNIQNTSKAYNDDKYKLEPCEINRPFEDYNTKGELVGYWWYEGDSVTLEFTIDGEIIVNKGEEDESYMPIEEFIKGKVVTFKLYNFRGETIYSAKFNDSYVITINNFSSTLKKGSYSCSLDITDGEEFNKTIFGQNACTITVK